MRIVPPSISFTLSTRVPRVTMTRCSRTSCTRRARIRGIRGRQPLSSVSDRAISEGQTDFAWSPHLSDRKIPDLSVSSGSVFESVFEVTYGLSQYCRSRALVVASTPSRASTLATLPFCIGGNAGSFIPARLTASIVMMLVRTGTTRAVCATLQR